MFGLMTSSDLTATQSNNARRQVFYQYPQGSFPLMGLLSLMDDAEEVDKQTFDWHEDRHILAKTTTVSADATNGPFTDTSGASGAVGANQTVAGWSAIVQATIRIRVTDASVFRVRDTIWVKDVAGTVASIKQVRGVVDAVWPSPNTIDVRLTAAVTNALNGGSTEVGMTIASYGSASVEGGYSKLGGTTFPIEPGNYTQIFRTPVGPFSRNALKMGQQFDSTGIYKHDAKKAHLRHMEMLELAALFGERNSVSVTDPDDGVSKIEKQMGGLLWFLKQWELGTVANGAHVTYRPSGSDLTASAWTASDDKRVCAINGSITENQFLDLIERAFFYNGDQSWEKLFICGQGVLAVFNKFAKQASLKTVNLNEKEDTYGMQVTMWETAFGNIYFKTHPLLTNNALFRYSGFIVDMGSIKYHSFQDSDTTLLTNRQARDFDGRKDEWLTEYGIEINFPERHMYIEGLTGITV